MLVKVVNSLILLISLFFIVSCSNQQANVQGPTEEISASVTLSESWYWGNQVFKIDQKYYSPNRKTWLIFQTDGNLVLYHNGRYVAQTKTYDHTPIPDSCIFQADGNFVLYKKGSPSRPVWNSQTWWYPGATLRINDDGYLRIVNTRGQVVWKTGPSIYFPGYTFPNW